MTMSPLLFSILNGRGRAEHGCSSVAGARMHWSDRRRRGEGIEPCRGIKNYPPVFVYYTKNNKNTSLLDKCNNYYYTNNTTSQRSDIQ